MIYTILTFWNSKWLYAFIGFLLRIIIMTKFVLKLGNTYKTIFNSNVLIFNKNMIDNLLVKTS